MFANSAFHPCPSVSIRGFTSSWWGMRFLQTEAGRRVIRGQLTPELWQILQSCYSTPPIICAVTPSRFLNARRSLLFCGVLFALAWGARADDFQGATHMVPFEEDSINYNNAVATGAVAQFQKRLDAGVASLKHDETYGYL